MAASYATDVGGGSHHDAILSLRDLPSFVDKYTVEYVDLEATASSLSPFSSSSPTP
jgi:hypothetical protein